MLGCEGKIPTPYSRSGSFAHIIVRLLLALRLRLSLTSLSRKRRVDLSVFEAGGYHINAAAEQIR